MIQRSLVEFDLNMVTAQLNNPPGVPRHPKQTMHTGVDENDLLVSPKISRGFVVFGMFDGIVRGGAVAVG